MSTLIYTSIAFVAGFLAAWIIQAVAIAKYKKLIKSSQGFLESEKLMKETLQKENSHVHNAKQTLEIELTKKLRDYQAMVKMMDTDILLLQKSNEETEALLQAGAPAVHTLKLQLIEAQNTIARYKAQLGIKDVQKSPEAP